MDNYIFNLKLIAILKKLLIVFLLTAIATVVNASEISSGEQRSDRKIIEITKIVKLSSNQEQAIRVAYDLYNSKVDSALYEVPNAKDAARVKYEAGKAFNKALMSILTEVQRNKYIEVTSTPEVEAKTEYKLSLLKEANEYSDLELQLKRKAIFTYLMSEKIVYARDKYDIKKQKENISRLKNLLPKALRESNIREKQKGQGKISNGSINW